MNFSSGYYTIISILLATNITAMQQTQYTYASKAQEFLKKITKNDTLFVDENIIIDYLKDRINMSSNAFGDKRNQEISETLCSEWCLVFAANQLEHSLTARINFYFPKMLEENLGFRLKKGFDYCIQRLEQPKPVYASGLKLITDEEFATKIDLQQKLLQESKKLAEETLSLLKPEK